MSQMQWTYIDDFGRRYRVGLYHGKTGHLLIHCNARVLVIDFNVLASKKYTFFINHELCDVHVERNADHRFAYGFEIDRKTPTPWNDKRRAWERTNLVRSLLFTALLITTIVAAAFLMLNGNQYF
jgi:hypothetical protein